MTEEDKKILRRCAGYLGLRIAHWSDMMECFLLEDASLWNPLKDDGDAFRLMARGRVSAYSNGGHVEAEADNKRVALVGLKIGDMTRPEATLRRAVVLAFVRSMEDVS